MGGGVVVVVGDGKGNNSINSCHSTSDVSNPFLITKQLLCSLLFNLETHCFNNNEWVTARSEKVQTITVYLLSNYQNL